MDSPRKAPEVQIPDQTETAASGASPDRSSAIPPQLPPQLPPGASTPAASRAKNAEKKSNAGIIWVVAIIFGLVIVVVILSSGGGSGSSTPSYSASSPSGGGGSYTPPPAPAVAYVPPISKALDEKNGFKDFRFGMTTNQARAVLEPTTTSRKPGANTETLFYSGTAANRIGEFATDSLGLQFFDGSLFRIDIRFSGSQQEIFEALKINYGEPFDNTTWKRGTEALKAKCWMGEKTYAAIVAPSYGTWDAVIIYDQTASQKAREYADKEPERAANDFSTNGFKSLSMGMRLQELTAPHTVTETSQITGVKSVTFTKDEWFAIGFYSLQSVSAEFFQDRLYRINFGFAENQKEILQTVEHRFGPLQKNDTWTRGTDKLTGKSGGRAPLYCTILAPGGSYGGDAWDLIVLMDYAIQREAEQFKQDAHREAAKDFSTNGFKSLAMGMRLSDLTIPYTVAEDNQVSGVKKILIKEGELLTIGFYPLRYVSCEFFKERLYRIDLEFKQNQKEIFQAFQHRFEPLQKNDTWTAGSAKLTGKSGGGDRLYGTILAPGGTSGGEEWETIVLLDGVLQREAAQFKLDAPKRAAKDL